MKFCQCQKAILSIRRWKKTYFSINYEQGLDSIKSDLEVYGFFHENV